MNLAKPNRDASGIPVIQEPASGLPDFFKILMRWKWLPILGSCLGLTVGYLIFSQQPPQFKATAQVQVISPGNEIPISTLEARNDTQSRSDELVVIQSPAVLKIAVVDGQLGKKRAFLGMSDDSIVQSLRQVGVLDLRLGSKDAMSNIISIGVTTDNAELSGEIVEAIVNAYKKFVTGKFEKHAENAIEALVKFNQDYKTRHDEVVKQLNELRTNPDLDLVWFGGQPRDPMGERILHINEIVSSLESKTRNIEAVLAQVKAAQDAGRPIEDCLKMVAAATNDDSLSFVQQATDATVRIDRIRAIKARAEIFEEREVTPLRNQLATELEFFGESYPSVIALKNKLSKAEAELVVRKEAALKEVEEFDKEFGNSRKEPVTLENRLAVACGALNEELQKMRLEKDNYAEEIKSLRKKSQSNQNAIGTYEFAIKDLEMLGQVTQKISENLDKLQLGRQYGQKDVSLLDLPRNGKLVGPSWIKYLGLGGLAGFAICCGLAYLLELADRSYRNPEEISSDLGMPIIGHLPLATISRTDRIDDKVDSSVVTLHKPRSPLSEAVRGVRTALFFGCQGNTKVIQVTSPIPGDGKSTVACNLAVSIAQSGRKVCIVDCDFRRPRMGKILGLREDVGMVQVISGKVTLDQALQQSSIENLSGITCGRRPQNPAELLSSEAFGDLLTELRDRFDYVLVDTPPMLVVSDPAIVCASVDAVLLTVRLRRNLRPIASRAAQMLHALNANLIGVVVNGIGVGGNGYGYGGYRYDHYRSGKSGQGYGTSGYGGYGYGSTYQYGGYYGGASGLDYYDEDTTKRAAPPKKEVHSTGT